MYVSSDLRLASGKKFILVGTPEGDEIKDPSRSRYLSLVLISFLISPSSEMESLPDVVNDLDFDFSDNLDASAAYKNDQRNIRKIKQATDNLNVNVISPLRPGKKLLVLDIDYTILDTKPLTSGSLPPAECARPFLHEFLETIYPYYDRSRSQTSWIWLETKLVELGMIGSNRNYQISFVLDKTCMFTVFTERDGRPWNHQVKSLQIIWNKFPQYDATNTIHVDDLSRNFALNPKEGLKIHAFKNAHTPEAIADQELKKLAKYLLHIHTADFRNLRHKILDSDLTDPLKSNLCNKKRRPISPDAHFPAEAFPSTWSQSYSGIVSPTAGIPAPIAQPMKLRTVLPRRNPEARHFGGVHVFPGGNFDRKQDTSLVMTAIRETFEESGILLASRASHDTSTTLTDEVLDDARRNIHSQKLGFQAFLSSQNMTPDVNSLLPFTQWITPANVSRRFHTHFFIAFLPATSSSGFSSGTKQDRIPKHDGGQEVISARYLHPAKAIQEFREGQITLMPPQAYLLHTLSEIFQGQVNTPAQRERVETLSKGLFGRMVLNPLRLGSVDGQGRSILTYEGDETRGGSKGRRHRVVVKAGKGGITSEVTVERNFDIFTEIEPHVFNSASKL
ncbi:hypothetical protein C0993_004549 [Termitomyces sp. T159_Od127]|nr:hypothetical protein C0993_004549 [Termitomyces sp. T159_Od127]